MPELRTAAWPADESTLRALRERVFIEEQGVPRAIEWDGRDAGASHVIAHRDGAAIACGRLLADGKIGRMAVLPEARGEGVGARVLAALLDEARRRGLREVYLHAQRHAEGFYRRQGFSADGEPFLEAAIEHLAMTRELSYRHCGVAVSPVRYPRPFGELLLALAGSARRQFAVLSPQLDPLVFEEPELLSALTALRRSHRDARIRLLVADGRALTVRGHRLLELARRLPSAIALRELEEHPAWPGDTLVLRDSDGLLWHAADSPDAGRYDPADRPGGARALDRFELLWQQGRVLPDFRALHL
jgi:predicted GNAT family N-acyltransferase